jgi:hypothetical protein
VQLSVMLCEATATGSAPSEVVDDGPLEQPVKIHPTTKPAAMRLKKLMIYAPESCTSAPTAKSSPDFMALEATFERSGARVQRSTAPPLLHISR